MCTVVMLRRPGHAWPLLLGANRDEMGNRPWKPPARHWPDRADVVAGLDELAGGTWMGLNDNGVTACILNRYGSLGPAPGKRSRGELVLDALDHSDAQDAARFLKDIDPGAYRPFNMLIADNRDAWWLAMKTDTSDITLEPIPEGLSMFTAHDRNDTSDARIGTYLPLFQKALPPDPDAGDWASWQALFGANTATGEPYTAMSFKTDSGFGTSSSSLLALPSIEAAHGESKIRPIWLFAPGRPESVPFAPVDISGGTRPGLH
ncbi:MAG: NRDE family protein [Rhodospirillaceae bacterium]|nr:NRDE family protein [Rhodospirillaceae bacterium]